MLWLPTLGLLGLVLTPGSAVSPPACSRAAGVHGTINGHINNENSRSSKQTAPGWPDENALIQNCSDACKNTYQSNFFGIVFRGYDNCCCGRTGLDWATMIEYQSNSHMDVNSPCEKNGCSFMTDCLPVPGVTVPTPAPTESPTATPECTGRVNMLGIDKKAKFLGSKNAVRKNKKTLSTNDVEQATCECYTACAIENEDYFMVTNKDGQLSCSCKSGFLRKLKPSGRKKSHNIGWISEKAKQKLTTHLQATA